MKYYINGDLIVEHIEGLSSGGNRNTKPPPIIQGFPNPQVNIATEFTFTFNGKIWPESKALELIALCKNPDNTDITLHQQNDEGLFYDGIASGTYSIKQWVINLKKPVMHEGGLAYNFSMQLTQYADAGDTEDTDTGESGNVLFDLLGVTEPKDYSIPTILGTIVTVFSAGLVDGLDETEKILDESGLPTT